MTNSALAIRGGPTAVRTDPGATFNWPIITKEDEDATLQVLRRGAMSGCDVTIEFEKEFASWQGTKYALACNNGTAALQSAMFGCRIGVGDELICPTVTYWASALPCFSLGATVVFAEIDPSTLCLDPNDIEQRITEHTKAIMVVHYGGIPAPLRAIREVAEAHGLPVIEDAAHALGARYDGVPIGCHSEYVMFSLQAIKHMTTVDGGMLACRDPHDLARGREFRWFGIDRQAPRTEADVNNVGYKYHMNNVTATIGLVQLDHIASVVERHIANGRYFDEALRGVSGLDLCRWEDVAEPSYWFYTVLTDRRDDLSRYLSERGIGNSQCHKRNDRHSVFASSRRELPGLDSFYARMLHIPCGWWVSDEDKEFIADTIKQGW